MRIDIISLFPEFIEAFYHHSIIKRACEAGILDLDVTNPRTFTYDKHHMADDTPYGGGRGMLMKAEPLFRAVEAVRRSVSKRRIILMGPGGTTFDQEKAHSLAAYDQLILLCGHYEGVDHRVEQYLAEETISIGDYVLTGGEIPAMAVTDAVARMIPGVLAAGSAAEDSFCLSAPLDSEQQDATQTHRGSCRAALLEYPQYTKPALFRSYSVPEVLCNGDHAKIDTWRRRQSLQRTLMNRPDLLEHCELSAADQEFIDTLKREMK